MPNVREKSKTKLGTVRTVVLYISPKIPVRMLINPALKRPPTYTTYTLHDNTNTSKTKARSTATPLCGSKTIKRKRKTFVLLYGNYHSTTVASYSLHG